MDPSAPPSAVPPRSRPPWGLILGLGCGGCAVLLLIIGVASYFFVRTVTHKTPLPASQHAYTGDWEGADGTTLSIRADGSGGFVAGSSNVTGGQVKIDEAARTLSVGFMGIEKTWKIDEPPHEEDGQTVMLLDGMKFRRTSGFAPPGGGESPATDDDPGGTDSGSADSGATGSGGMGAAGTPSESELRRMVADDLMEFNTAIREEDFSGFYDGVHPVWKGQTTAEALKNTFQVFIDKDIDLSAVDEAEALFDGAPATDDRGVMTVSGRYDLSPQQVQFKLDYLPDGSEWKLVGLNVNVR